MKTTKANIKSIKRIIAKHGNLMAGEINSEFSISYGSLGNFITALIEEYKVSAVNIVIYDCRSGKEIDDFDLPYEKLTKDTIFEISSYLEDYEAKKK